MASSRAVPNGSPPRVWGIRQMRKITAGIRRFTPTRVGNTRCVCVTRVHQYGSPPRVWGIRRIVRAKPCVLAVHPHACGEYCTSSSRYQHSAVHPHACGEYYCSHVSNGQRCGSPPRVWGIRQAYAAASSAASVHPHTCGEYTDDAGSPHARIAGSPPHVWGIREPCGHVDLVVGSPPHVWGILHVGCGMGRLDGSPPRVWGIRIVGSSDNRVGAVHPHACGEYVDAVGSLRLAVHPHACGEYWLLSHVARVSRFTPTRVGNTSRSLSCRIAVTVHPHTCGEYERAAHDDAVGCRFTPTRVGNTLKRLLSTR